MIFQNHHYHHDHHHRQSLIFIINIVTSVQTTISSTSNNTRMYIILYAHRIGITRVNNLQPSINKCRTSNTEEATIKHSNLDHISKNTFQWQYKLININNHTSVTSTNNGERTFNQIALSYTTLIYDKQKCNVNLAFSLDNLLYNHSQVQ